MVGLRCLIVDDNAPFVAAARRILEGGQLTVLGAAATGAEALERADRLAPDVILLDIDLGGESGLDVARDLAQRAVGCPPLIVLVSGHAEDDFADLIAEGPAVGFVAKSELSAAAIVDLVRTRGAATGNRHHRESK